MTQAAAVLEEAGADRELVLTKILDAPRGKVWRCWTEPSLLKQWFAPRPWTTPHAEMDVRPGGKSRVVMRSPEGADCPNPGVFLEVLPDEKLWSGRLCIGVATSTKALHDGGADVRGRRYRQDQIHRPCPALDGRTP